jgi:hypothetical protein
MKKSLILLSLFSILLTSCELTIGDNVNCSCKCGGEEQSCGKTEKTTTNEEVNNEFNTDEYNVEEDTLVY